MKLDGARVGAAAGKVTEEVIQQVATLKEGEVNVTLEAEVRVPGGISDDVVRAVLGNCGALKFRSSAFEGE